MQHLQDAEQYVHIINKLKHWKVTMQNWYTKTEVYIADSILSCVHLCLYACICMHVFERAHTCERSATYLGSTQLTPT
jgi:hypothetical protein